MKRYFFVKEKKEKKKKHEKSGKCMKTKVGKTVSKWRETIVQFNDVYVEEVGNKNSIKREKINKAKRTQKLIYNFALVCFFPNTLRVAQLATNKKKKRKQKRERMQQQKVDKLCSKKKKKYSISTRDKKNM
jgi:hypothetical protein